MCEGCMEIKPLVKKASKVLGYKYKEINVDHCSSKTCNELEYVPAIFVNDKKLNLDQMEDFLEKIL